MIIDYRLNEKEETCLDILEQIVDNWSGEKMFLNKDDNLKKLIIEII